MIPNPVLVDTAPPRSLINRRDNTSAKCGDSSREPRPNGSWSFIQRSAICFNTVDILSELPIIASFENVPSKLGAG